MKTQMKFQKRLCFTLLILGALCIVLALIFSTGVLAGFASTYEKNAPQTNFTEAQVFTDIQGYNNQLLYLGIVVILAVVVLYITATNKRRNYYISNYVATIVVAALLLGVSVYVIIENSIWLGNVMDVLNNADAMARYEAIYKGAPTVIRYSTNIFTFVLCYILYFLVIVGAAALVLNLVWKIKLMKGEKALLEQGFAKEVA